MQKEKFERLLKRKLITLDELDEVRHEAEVSGAYIEDLLLRLGIPRHEILFCLSEHYGCPFVEYEENLIVSQSITRRMDMEKLKRALWIPLSVSDERAKVIVYAPDNPEVSRDIKKTLAVEIIECMIALPSDIVRIIENNQDLNPGFPPSAGRTPLAKVRTFLAEKRSAYACQRTTFAKGRTGLAFLRTGISFAAIALVLFRVFGFGYLTILEVVLLISGAVMTIDGLMWYIPAREKGKRYSGCQTTEPTWGTTILEVSNPGNDPLFSRTGPIKGARELRDNWPSLSPVMRRRFLASDRTDLAEERTTLACYRTTMARARTGLSFTRTGIAFIGAGIALLRQFGRGPWTLLDSALILIGLLMAAEGFHWYLPGRSAGMKGIESVKKAENKESIWDFIFPPSHKVIQRKDASPYTLPVKGSHSPGIWATTGLALERTVLADRRNVMARLRTIMARSRTGLAFVRTGMSVSAVGIGLLVYFGISSTLWTIFDLLLLVGGLALIADGFYWHLPAERMRKQFPYCFGEMEIVDPDYGRPVRFWSKAVFSHDDLS